MGRLSKFLALFLIASAFAADVDHDTDGDGLDDVLEQKLLEQFAPRFHVATGDCDGVPSEFVAGLPEPKWKARNGTIYGQVSPAPGGVEIHYYHLWAQDCGGSATSHALDAESVAVRVIRAEDGWQATHWFASAHEDTLCDVSNAVAKSGDSGVDVWISRDKHASFLSAELCARSGCGKDRCDLSEVLAVRKIVNLGEPDAWMNGAEWAGSSAWTLRHKMLANFDSALLARLHSEPAIVSSRIAPRGAHTAIKVAASTYAGLETANQSTANGLATATGATSRALTKSTDVTRRALRRAFQWK